MSARVTFDSDPGRSEAALTPLRRVAVRTSSSLTIVLAAIFVTARASSPIVVPLRLAEHFPIVTATIGGMDVPLVFDSGDASTVVLQRSVLDHVNAVPTGETFKGSNVKGNMLSPKYRIARLQIGKRSSPTSSAVLQDQTNPAPDVGQKGLLGTGLLKSYRLVLDYSHRTMTLLPGDGNENVPESCQGTVVPFSPIPPANRPSEPVTEADTDLGRVTLWWDTGAQVSFLSKKFVQQAQAHLSKDDALVTKRLTFGGTDFGPWRFETMEMALPAFFNGFLGYDFFASHIVCIDFPGRRIVIQQ